MTTTAVQDRLDLDVEAYKARRGITGTDKDDEISDALEAAKRAADEYMGNPFTARRAYSDGAAAGALSFNDLANWDGNRLDGGDCGSRTGYGMAALREEGAAELPIPAQVKLGVMAYVDAVLDAFSTADGAPGSGAHNPAPVTSEKVGELAKTWASSSEKDLVAGGAYLGRLGFIAETYWLAFRLEPGF